MSTNEITRQSSGKLRNRVKRDATQRQRPSLAAVEQRYLAAVTAALPAGKGGTVPVPKRLVRQVIARASRGDPRQQSTLRRALSGRATFEEILTLLPPKLQQKLLNDRHEAVQAMLDAWRESLQRNAEMDKQAAKRAAIRARRQKRAQQSSTDQARSLRAAEEQDVLLANHAKAVPITAHTVGGKLVRRPRIAAAGLTETSRTAESVATAAALTKPAVGSGGVAVGPRRSRQSGRATL